MHIYDKIVVLCGFGWFLNFRAAQTTNPKGSNELIAP